MAPETTPPGKPDPLVMPADEFAALRTVAERFGIGVPSPAPAEPSGEAMGPAEGGWRVRAEAAEARLAAIREVLTMSLIETGDELGALERPADDSAMLDRALRLIGRLLAVIGTEEPGDGD